MDIGLELFRPRTYSNKLIKVKITLNINKIFVVLIKLLLFCIPNHLLLSSYNDRNYHKILICSIHRKE